LTAGLTTGLITGLIPSNGAVAVADAVFLIISGSKV
jgi:hypothetical protein